MLKCKSPEQITATQIAALGPNLRRLRVALHMSQWDLATAAGVTQSDIAKAERGQPVTRPTVGRIVDALYAAYFPKATKR
ncbi:MAG: helix-turn-helix domain-containing protein [Betaproteobacteria bacterium]|nr:helix-turn-helix domain-containing protein [Betaproteobacteria bacterium]